MTDAERDEKLEQLSAKVAFLETELATVAADNAEYLTKMSLMLEQLSAMAQQSLLRRAKGHVN